MRIALCMFGMPRCVKTGREVLGEAFIDKYKPDVFVHTWMEHPYPQGYKDGYVQDTVSRVENINKIMVLYKPLSMTVDKHHIFKDWYYTEEKVPIFHASSTSMHESIYLVNQLKIKYENENNMKYDIVIHCRFDANLLTPLHFENFDMKKIYCKRTGVNPQIQLHNDVYFSSSDNMDKYANLYNNLKQVVYTFSTIPFTPKIWIPDPAQLHLMYYRGIEGPSAHEVMARYAFMANLPIEEIPLNLEHPIRDKE